MRTIGVSVPIHSLPPRSTTGDGPNQGLSLMYLPANLASSGSDAGRDASVPARAYEFGPQFTSLTEPPLRSEHQTVVAKRRVGGSEDLFVGPASSQRRAIGQQRRSSAGIRTELRNFRPVPSSVPRRMPNRRAAGQVAGMKGGASRQAHWSPNRRRTASAGAGGTLRRHSGSYLRMLRLRSRHRHGMTRRRTAFHPCGAGKHAEDYQHA